MRSGRLVTDGAAAELMMKEVIESAKVAQPHSLNESRRGYAGKVLARLEP